MKTFALTRVLTLGTVLLYGGAVLEAQPLLDQINDVNVPGGNSIGTDEFSFTAIAQTFTTGIAGTFHSADLRLKSTTIPPTTDLIVRLYNVNSGGKPATILGSATLALGSVLDVYQWFKFDFSSLGLAVNIGDVFALGYDVPGYFWNFDGDNSYADGTSHYSTLASTQYQFTDVGDYLFKTYVETDDVASVPEPSIIALLAFGIVGFGFARRRRQS